jgi:hypothetical protein
MANTSEQDAFVAVRTKYEEFINGCPHVWGHARGSKDGKLAFVIFTASLEGYESYFPKHFDGFPVVITFTGQPEA